MKVLPSTETTFSSFGNLVTNFDGSNNVVALVVFNLVTVVTVGVVTVLVVADLSLVVDGLHVD